MKPPDKGRPRARCEDQDHGEVVTTDITHLLPHSASVKLTLREERLPRGWSLCWRCGCHMGPRAPGMAPYWFTLNFGSPCCWKCLSEGVA